MDEVVGLLVEQLAKRARESRAKAVAQAGNRPGTPPPASPAPPAPAAASAARPPRPQPPRATPPDPFAAAGGSFANASAENPLLAAFAGRSALLAGIVLGEALAPPLALRERDSGRS